MFRGLSHVGARVFASATLVSGSSFAFCDDRSHASLICNESAVRPGTTIELGFYLIPASGWHTYWMNPGDSGGPTSFKLKLPKGWVAQNAIWPTPKRINLSGIVSYGYEAPTLIVVPVKVPDQVPAKDVSISGHVSWLTCTSEVCKPADQDVSLSLAVGPMRVSANAPKFERSLASVPKPLAPRDVTAKASSDGVVLSIAGATAKARLDRLYFFPYRTGIVDHSKPEKFFFSGSTLIGKLPKSPYSQTVPKRLSGLLVGLDGTDGAAVSLDVPVEPQG